MGFEYEIQYWPSKENMVADALSRRPDSATLNHLFVSQVSIWEQIKHAAVDDDYVKRITSLAHTQDTSPYVIRQRLVLFKGRVVVPLKLRETLIFEAHDTKVGGHSGVLRTFKHLATQFYWPSMYKTIHDYVSRCVICQKTKASTLKPAGLLQPLLIPCKVWDDITLDFIEGLPNSQGRIPS